MKNNKKLVLIVMFAMIFGGGIVGYCIGKSANHITVNCISEDTMAYRTGEIIYPDYACPDTLIVTDGKGLTAAMDNLLHSDKGGDLDCDSVLHQYCESYTIKQ